MRVFVTGANGQVGREVARVLASEHLYLATHQSDDVSSERIVESIARERPDLVIHAAAMTDVDACERHPERARLVNEVGARLVARGAERVGARLLAISTDYVFNGDKGSAYVESDKPEPINVYGATKLAGERAVFEETDRACVVRTAWVFGEGKNHFITFVLNRIRSGEPIRAVVDKFGSPTSAKDLVATVLRLVELQATGLFHVAGAGVCNWFDYAEAILRGTGLSHRVEPIPFAELNRPARRPTNSSLSSERLSALGISMRGWREMVEDYLQTHERLAVRPVAT